MGLVSLPKIGIGATGCTRPDQLHETLQASIKHAESCSDRGQPAHQACGSHEESWPPRPVAGTESLTGAVTGRPSGPPDGWTYMGMCRGRDLLQIPAAVLHAARNVRTRLGDWEPVDGKGTFRNK